MRIARAPVLALLALALVSASGCRRLPRVLRTKSQRIVTIKQLPPLSGAQGLEMLTLVSFEPSLVAVPVGAHFARPVVVALHGQADSAESNCQTWRTITDNSYFVLCPALLRRVTATDLASQPCTQWDCAAAELKEALVALRKRFGAYVAPKQVMLAGSGRGASLAVPIAQQNPTVFSIVWLMDGGFESWSSTLSSTYVERGGKLLGLACTSADCQSEVARIVASANAVGLNVADYRSTRDNAGLSPTLAISLKAAWESARPAKWPWVLPGARKSLTPGSP